MINDNGIYILVSPSETDESRKEYRVSYLHSTNNICWRIDEGMCKEAISPAIQEHFEKSEIYTDELDAQEEAYRIADSLYITQPPIFHVYLTTTYPKWSKTIYAQTN